MIGQMITQAMGPVAIRPLALALFILLACGAGASLALTPQTRVADTRDHDLERLIPASFDGWTNQERRSISLPDPAGRRLADKLYTQILSRIYRNERGEDVLLVIAYGGDQSDELQLHRPEVCYAASGYEIKRATRTDVQLGGRDILLTRVETRDAYGHEPVSYWMRVGDRQVTSNLDRQRAKLGTGLRGIVPDGVLVRVSTRTTSGDASSAYALQDRFIAALLGGLDGSTQALLLGDVQKGGRS